MFIHSLSPHYKTNVRQLVLHVNQNSVLDALTEFFKNAENGYPACKKAQKERVFESCDSMDPALAGSVTVDSYLDSVFSRWGGERVR